MGMRRGIALPLARTARFLSRRLGLGGGSSIPGVIVDRLDPGFVARKAASLTGGIIAVSGTNGKTTTTSMIRAILAAAGIVTVSNETGANMMRGVSTSLLDLPREATAGVFEIDEAWLVRLVPLLQPRVVVLTNVFRDQLDRFGEAESVAALLAKGAAGLPTGARVVVNADDPLLWHALHDRRPVGFGVRPLVPVQTSHRGDAEPETCPHCGSHLEYEMRTIAHLGRCRCISCGWASVPPAFEASVVEGGGLGPMTIEIAGERVDLKLGGLYNAYNAAAAVAAAAEFGIAPSLAAHALSTFRARFGRSEDFVVDGKPVQLVLAKNPAGASAVVRELATDPQAGAVVIAVSDQIADGRDISWIWDVDHERLALTGLPLVPGGRRAADVAVRLKYAGADPAPAETDPLSAIRSALARCPVGKTTFVLATYTAMLDVRHAVSRSRSQRLVDSMPSP